MKRILRWIRGAAGNALAWGITWAGFGLLLGAARTISRPDMLPYLPGYGPKPRGSGFYPVDMTREEFEALEDPEKTSLYTLITREQDGSLGVVPYHEAYRMLTFGVPIRMDGNVNSRMPGDYPTGQQKRDTGAGAKGPGIFGQCHRQEAGEGKQQTES